MKYFLVFILSFSSLALTEAEAVNFFRVHAKKKDRYEFNKYENLLSGTAAFFIGNVGYISSKNSVLKLTYSGIQTLGIINIGKGIYQINSRSIDQRFEELVTNSKVKEYSKGAVAYNLLEIYASEQRAKRLAMFYSSTILSFQYFLNAVAFDSPDQLKNSYIFLGGVNVIISLYSGFYKSDFEKKYFGDNIDLNPFLFSSSNSTAPGLSIVYKF